MARSDYLMLFITVATTGLQFFLRFVQQFFSALRQLDSLNLFLVVGEVAIPVQAPEVVAKVGRQPLGPVIQSPVPGNGANGLY